MRSHVLVLTLLAVWVSITGCSSSSSSSASSGPAVHCGERENLGIPGESSTTSFPACTDGNTYTIDCAMCDPSPYTCDCKVNDKATGKTFTTSSALCDGESEDDFPAINAACGWNLQR